MSYVATDAAAYERSMGRWSRALAEPFLDALSLPRGARVLDAGCGTGALAAAILSRDPSARVIGIEPGAAYLAAAGACLPAARFVPGDIAPLPLPEGSQDAALALLVLGFVPDPAAAVAELRRVARPGGVVATAMWDFFGGFSFLRLFADTAALLPKGAAWRAHPWSAPIGSPGRLAALFKGSGLLDVTERDITIRQNFSGFSDWWGPWLTGQGIVGAFVATLADAERALLKRALRAAWGEDGPRSFVATARIAIGRRE